MPEAVATQTLDATDVPEPDPAIEAALAPEIALDLITRQLGRDRPPTGLTVSSVCQPFRICFGVDGGQVDCPSEAWTCTAYYGSGPDFFDSFRFQISITRRSVSGVEWLVDCFLEPHGCSIRISKEQAAKLCEVDWENSGVYLSWVPETKRLAWFIWEGPPYEDIYAEDRHCTDAH